MRTRLKGFTLIELLIVVAIIAILAAIAVPNFLEAQVRSKVSRVKADMRSYATALEAYCVDNNEYPSLVTLTGASLTGVSFKPLEQGLIPLSTPVSYMTDALVVEPFNGKHGWVMYRGWNVIGAGGPPPDAGTRQAIYAYVSLPNSSESIAAIMIPLLLVLASPPPAGKPPLTAEDAYSILYKRWFLVSSGPDTYYAFDQYRVANPSAGVIPGIIQEVGACTIVKYDGIYDPTNGTVSAGEIVRTAEGFFNDKK